MHSENVIIRNLKKKITSIKIKLKIKIKSMDVGPIFTTFYLENGKTYKTSIDILNNENFIWKAKRNKSSKMERLENKCLPYNNNKIQFLAS